VLNSSETEVVCDYIRGRGERAEFLRQFGGAMSAGFDPDRDLCHIGLANQTTMLMSESLAIGEMLRTAVADRFGEPALPAHFQAFDTICSATQDRQDAVVAMLADAPPDLMIVIGGYNSSNTCNLARICAARCPTYHIAEPDGLISRDVIRYRPAGTKTEVTAGNWLPVDGPVTVGLTSGASTPDNLVGAAVEKLAAFCS
jgi:4-hydroxy-3-methylbut-2-enyl diphosphate reductase